MDSFILLVISKNVRLIIFPFIFRRNGRKGRRERRNGRKGRRERRNSWKEGGTGRMDKEGRKEKRNK